MPRVLMYPGHLIKPGPVVFRSNVIIAAMTDRQISELSERELEILRLVATGASNKEIAQKLFISANTVKVHLRNIFSKVGVASRTEAAMYVVRSGLLESDEIPPEFQEGKLTDSSLEQAGEQVVLEIEPVIPQSDTAPAQEGLVRRLSTRPASLMVLFVVLVLIGGAVVLNTLGAEADRTPEAQSAFENSRWRTLAPLPEPLYGHAVTAYENNIYAIGGENTTGISGVVYQFDLKTDTWVELNQKPVPVAESSAAVIGGLIFLPGGRTDGGVPTDIMEVYDPRQDQWERRANLPVAVSGHSLATFEGRLYLFGGWDGSRYLDSVYEYELASDSWRELSPMPSARAFAGAAVAGGKIHIIGGFDGSSVLDANDIYFPELEAGNEDPWFSAKPLPDGRYGMGVTSIADYIQVIGGISDQVDYFPAISYSSSLDEWLLLENPGAPLGSFIGAVHIGGDIYVIGGVDEDVIKTDTLVYKVFYTLSIPIIINP
jgi:DNA-binding CsgD family transcriptional regulator